MIFAREELDSKGLTLLNIQSHFSAVCHRISCMHSLRFPKHSLLLNFDPTCLFEERGAPSVLFLGDGCPLVVEMRSYAQENSTFEWSFKDGFELQEYRVTVPSQFPSSNHQK